MLLSAALFCPTLSSRVTADEILPPVVSQPVGVPIPEVGEYQPSPADDSCGRFSLDDLAPALVLAPHSNADDVGHEAIQQSRELMGVLRSRRTVQNRHPEAAIVPSAVVGRGTGKTMHFKVAPSPNPPPRPVRYSDDTVLQMNSVLLRGGDEKSTTIQLEPLPPVGVVPALDAPAQLPSLDSGPGNDYFHMNSYSRKEIRRSRRQSQGGGRFVEFYDPESEQLDVDDYEHSVLLVGGSTDEGSQPGGREASALLSRKLTDIKPSLSYAWGDIDVEKLPTDFYKRMDKGEYVEIVAPRTVLQWEPTNLWYYPLYFEDVGLERYGHTRKPWVQPFVSTGRFFGQVAMLPYQMTLHSPQAKEFALGHYQPGEWAPKKKYQIPFNEEASTVEFLWITGLILLIP